MREIVEIAARLAELERRVSGTMRSGRVHEVDAKEGWVRLNFGQATGGGDFLSPKIPYAQTAGSVKFHNPPSKDQQMTLIAPAGDWQQAVALPMTWSDINKTPNDKGDEHEMTFGSCRVHMSSDKLVLSVGGSSITIADGRVDIKSALINTDGKTTLNNGSKQVHRIGDKDSDLDVATEGADDVYA